MENRNEFISRKYHGMSKAPKTSPKKKSRKRQSMMALFLMGVLVGGVAAAMILSNTITADFEVYTTMPIALTWTDDPSDSYMNQYDTATGTLSVVNAQDANFTNIQISVEITCPLVAVGETDMISLTIDGAVFDWTDDFSGSSGTFTASKAMSDIEALSTDSWAFSFGILETSGMEGSWTISMTLTGDPV